MNDNLKILFMIADIAISFAVMVLFFRALDVAAEWIREKLF